ncbi:Uncharacterized protein ACMD2_06292 [Ananas comosus]|nr:Uncharacterized protein ACMD2_06292 [Ananas comosus]
MTMEDAEWFKRLTGRTDVAVSARDYKFYSPRHKYRRTASQAVFNIPGPTTFSGSDSSPLVNATGFRPLNEPQNQQEAPSKQHMQQLPNQPQFQPFQQAHHQIVQQSQHAAHISHLTQCTHSSHVTDITQQHQSPNMSQHLACLQSMSAGHLGGRLNLLPSSPAKFCDECGAPYLRETSKFCSECGTKRLGI